MKASKRLEIRLTEEQLNTIKQHAKEANQTVTDYIIFKTTRWFPGNLPTTQPVRTEIVRTTTPVHTDSNKDKDVQESVFTFKCVDCGDRYTKQNPHHLCPPCDDKKFPKVKE